jgi:hypothetical protein
LDGEPLTAPATKPVLQAPEKKALKPKAESGESRPKTGRKKKAA